MQKIGREYLETIEEAQKIAKNAARHRKSVLGSGFYATKFLELHTRADKLVSTIKQGVTSASTAEIIRSSDSLGALNSTFFKTAMKPKERLLVKNNIVRLVKLDLGSLFAQEEVHVPSDKYFPLELVKLETRKYILRIAEQACGSYDKGWYDACAVMTRRLVETLMIECYETYKITNKIKYPDDSFFRLADLISAFLQEKSWSIGRDLKSALPKLKDIGDKSAHSRTFTARKADIDLLRNDVRTVIEALVATAKLS